jgi:hypothetical protein
MSPNLCIRTLVVVILEALEISRGVRVSQNYFGSSRFSIHTRIQRTMWNNMAQIVHLFHRTEPTTSIKPTDIKSDHN